MKSFHRFQTFARITRVESENHFGSSIYKFSFYTFSVVPAISAFEFQFQLDYAANYELSGSSQLLIQAPFRIADTEVSLVGPNLDQSYSAYNNGLDLNWSGSLSPGIYSVSLVSHASGSVIEQSSASFAGQLHLVMHGDFNVDCQLTATDIDLLSEDSASFSPRLLSQKGNSIIPSLIYDHPVDFQRCISMVEKGIIKPGIVVTRYFSLQQLPEALKEAQKGQDPKIVIRVSERSI